MKFLNCPSVRLCNTTKLRLQICCFTFSHLPLMVSSHADSLDFICRDLKSSTAVCLYRNNKAILVTSIKTTYITVFIGTSFCTRIISHENCWLHLKWIIWSDGTLSGKRCGCRSFKCSFSMLWGPQTRCHSPLLCCSGSRNVRDLYLKKWSNKMIKLDTS